jgi:hypothetical protein
MQYAAVTDLNVNDVESPDLEHKASFSPAIAL